MRKKSSFSSSSISAASSSLPTAAVTSQSFSLSRTNICQLSSRPNSSSTSSNTTLHFPPCYPHPSHLRSDRFNNGVDFDEIAEFQRGIDKLREDYVIPNDLNYDIQNPLQLTTKRVVDFTDRSSILTAKKYNFDPDGFRKGRPLEKAMFYMDPYITCSWCNNLSFVDVQAVRRKMNLPEEVGSSIKPESLPPCKKCKKSDHFVIGSHDFSAIIADRERLAKEKAARELKASNILKRSYRAYLRRAYGTAANKARIVRRYLENKAATIINAVARGRLARRISYTKKHLKFIKHAHPVLIAYSLKPMKGRSKLFWYSKQQEIDMLFENYVDLCARLGFMPPRQVVEKNIAELARRIKEREEELLLLVQRHWRGVMARRIVKYFRTEVVRLRQYFISRVLIIQRAYRGHCARLLIPKLIALRRREALMKSYQDRASKQIKQTHVKKIKDTMMSAYVRERAEEKTARFTQRIDLASDHDDRKMKAFAASCYAGEELPRQIDSLMHIEIDELHEKKRNIQREKDRRAFIGRRYDEHGPEGFGLRGIKPGEDTAKAVIVNGFLVGEAPASSRMKGMKKLFEQEKTELMHNLIDRVTKDFGISHSNLLPKFREYNDARRLLATDAKSAASIEMTAGVTGRVGSPKRASILRDSNSNSRRHNAIKAGKDASAANLFRPREYKFPANINERPMLWLDEDIDATLKFSVKQVE